MTSDLLDAVKPQLDALRMAYITAYEEGRRSAFAEMLPYIKKLQELFEALFPSEFSK